MIASVPPITGLYTAMLPVLLYAVMGTSRQLSVGMYVAVVTDRYTICFVRFFDRISGTTTKLPLK